MHYTISLDAGTNSTGFAVLDEQNTLLELGVDIFPMGNKEEKGVESSRNAERRGYRGARRNRFRYYLRRTKLLKKLTDLGMAPDFKEVTTAFQLYEARTNALSKQISLSDLGRIFMLFNKYRGFKSSRKETGKDDDKAKEEGVIKNEINRIKGRMEAYGCQTVGQYFFKMFEKSRELYERGEWHNPDEPYDERALDDNNTFSLLKSRGIRREGRHLERALLEAEFELIWEKQRQYYPKLLTEENRSEIKDRTIFYQRPLKSPKKFIGKCTYEKRKQCAPLSSLVFQEFRVLKQLLDIRLTDSKNIEITNSPLDDEQRGKLYELLCQNAKLSFTEVKKALALPKSTSINTEELGKHLLGNATLAQLREAVGEALFDELSLTHRLEKLWHVLYFHQDEGWLRRTLADKWGFDAPTIDALVEVHLENGYAGYSTKVLNKIIPHLKKGTHEREALKEEGYDVEQNHATRPLRSRISPLKNNELRNPVVEKATMRVIRLVNQLIKKYEMDPEKLTIRIESTRELKKPKKERQKIRSQNLETEKKRRQYADFLTKFGAFGLVHPGSSVIPKFELWLELGEDKDDLKEFQKFIADAKNYDLHIEKYRLWLEQGMKCPYTFKSIPLRELMSPEVEIEHIIPYSRSMDNSFVNKTLSYAAANKEKGNRTAYEYMAQKGDGSLLAFKNHVEKVFKGSPQKQQRFLQKENKEDKDFRPDQLTNTSYIARQIKTKLMEVSRDVQFTNGAATAALRRHWRIAGLLEEVMYEEQTGTEMWQHFANRNDEANQAEIRRYREWLEQFGKGKNRTDHRHHALDALVIGLCTPGIIKQISTFHRVREELKLAYDDHEGKLHYHDQLYRLPGLPIQKSIIRQALKHILVASQPDHRRLLVTQRNRIKTKKSGTKTQRVKSVRGALFQETFFGKIQKPHAEAFDRNEVYVTRKTLSADLIKSEADLDKIVDVQVREILRRRLELYRGDAKKAFSEEEMRQQPIYMYSLRDYPDAPPTHPSSKAGKTLPVIKKVRTINKNFRSLVHLPAKDPTGKVVATNRFAEKDGNYIMAFYEGYSQTKKGERKRTAGFRLITNPEAVRQQLDGKPLFSDELVTEKGQTLRLNPLCPCLKKGDFVVCYENDPSEIRWDDRTDLFRRLYQVTRLEIDGSTGFIKLARHNISRYNLDYTSVKGAYSFTAFKTHLFLRHTQMLGVKVKVSQLGEVKRLDTP